MKSLEIGDQVAVRDLRALWTAGCAAGVNDDGSIVFAGRVGLSVCGETRIETTGAW